MKVSQLFEDEKELGTLNRGTRISSAYNLLTLLEERERNVPNTLRKHLWGIKLG